ncbi:MAG TPA: efflux transporter outer membrane subunit [Steroidobacteraceae bacterium]
MGLITAAALAGCITPPVGPNYKRPVAPLPTTWRIDAAEAVDVTNTAWWQQFGDADLNGLIDEALIANSDILIAAARIEQFDGKLEVSNSHKYPQFGIEAGFMRNFRSLEVPEELGRAGQPATYNVMKIGPTIDFEFDLWGKVRRANEAARAELLSTKEARHTVMLTEVTTVANNYIQLLELDRDLAIAQQTLASLKKALALTDEKYHGGSATLLTVGQVRAEVANQEAAIPQLERSISSLEDGLSTLVGRNPGAIKRGHLDQLVLAPVPEGVPSDVLSRRPDVLVAEQNLVAANARIGVAKSGYFPSVPLTGMYGVASDMLRYILARDAGGGLYDLQVLGPLLSFGKVQGDVRKARAEAKENVERYLQSVRVALQEVNDALIADVDSKTRLAALNRRVTALREVDQLTQMRYEGGESTLLDVFESDRQVYAAQSQETQGIGDEFIALISVYKAMGGGWMVEQDKPSTAKNVARAAPASVPTSVQAETTTKEETTK